MSVDSHDLVGVLLRRLHSGEDNWSERKPPGVNRAEIRRALTAFANSVPDGLNGVLFVGVSNSGEIRGVNEEAAIDTINAAAADIYPPVRHDCTVLTENGLKAIAVRVHADNASRPHFSGKAYIRVGNETKDGTADQYAAMIASRSSKVFQLEQWKTEFDYITLRWWDDRGNGPYKLRAVVERLGQHHAEFFAVPAELHERSIPVASSLDKLTFSWDSERGRPMVTAER
jgi:hypothetical protein